MGHPADIRLINPHAKGHSCYNDQPIFALKASFHDAAVFGIHTTMVMTGRMPSLTQSLRQGFGFGARATIHNAGLSVPCACKFENLLARLILGRKGQMQIGPVKPMQKAGRRNAVK